MPSRPTDDGVNACVFSPCGEYLICGTGLGRLLVWRFSKPVDGVAPPTRVVMLRAHASAVYALTFVQTKSGLLLLSGGDEEICGWLWEAVLHVAEGAAIPEPTLRLENARTSLRRGAIGQLSETSALAVDAAAGKLYSAAGDGNAYAWDLATQTCVSTFSGVGEPLYCLALCERRHQLVTGGEDGAVRLWDVRAATRCTQTLRPGAPPLATAATPSGGGSGGGGGGGWCGCVTTDAAETWLVAGWGDGFLCSIDLNTLASVACMPTAAAPLACTFEPGSDFHLLSVGAEAGLYHWKLTGELETRATCSSPSALGLATARTPAGTRVIAVGGSAGTVDIFNDPSHRAFTLSTDDSFS